LGSIKYNFHFLHACKLYRSAFENHLKIPEENIELGQYSILITNVKALVDRIKSVVNMNNFKMQARLMEYYDPTVFHGVFKEEEAVLKKHLRFSHQREYRIAIDTGINIT
jgi:hypothetical protein